MDQIVSEKFKDSKGYWVRGFFKNKCILVIQNFSHDENIEAFEVLVITDNRSPKSINVMPISKDSEHRCSYAEG